MKINFQVSRNVSGKHFHEIIKQCYDPLENACFALSRFMCLCSYKLFDFIRSEMVFLHNEFVGLKFKLIAIFRESC